MTIDSPRAARARLGAAQRYAPHDLQRISEARSSLEAANLKARIQAAVKSEFPPTFQQRCELAHVLTETHPDSMGGVAA